MGDCASFCGFGVKVKQGYIQKPTTTKLESSCANHGRKCAGVVNDAFSSYNAQRVKL